MNDGVHHVQVDMDVCQGHGRCYSLADTIFVADDEGFPTIHQANVSGELLDEARRAERACPERAISVRIGARA